MRRLVWIVLVACSSGRPDLPDPIPAGTQRYPLACTNGLCSCYAGNCDGTCSGSPDCSINCSGGQCDITCDATRSCTLYCSSGKCVYYCPPNERCDLLDCSGGDCSAWCPRGSFCNFYCSGGGCTFACDGTCTIDCSSGCACTGTGCPHG